MFLFDLGDSDRLSLLSLFEYVFENLFCNLTVISDKRSVDDELWRGDGLIAGPLIVSFDKDLGILY